MTYTPEHVKQTIRDSIQKAKDHAEAKEVPKYEASLSESVREEVQKLYDSLFPEDEAKEAPVPMKIETGSLQPRDTPKPPRKQEEPSILDKLYDGCPVSDPTSPINFFFD